MTAAIDITTSQRKELLALLRRYIPGVAVWAYGSRVKWTARANSDLDLVAFTTSEQQPLVSVLKEALAESDLPFPVDFHVWDDVPERFHEIIRKEYVVVQEARKPEVGLGISGHESTIGALLDETGGSIKTGPFGTKLKASEYTATGVPVISVGEVGFGRLRIHHDTPRVDESVSNRMPEFLLTAGDIVFGRKGAVERSAQLQPDEDGYFLGSDGIRIRLNTAACDPKFIAYQLQTTAHRSWMIQHAAGTTMPSLNEGIIRRIPIVLPPLAEQKSIAAVLGALDDKIELNRRMNATLEAMARALFQSWFVDFDPVRAKLDNRQPTGLDKATADLFPEHLEDSPIGHIPKGWKVGTVVEGFNLTMGQSPPGDTYNEDGDGLPFYQGRTDFGFRFPTRRIYCSAPTRNAKTGDTLVSVRAPVGDINMANEGCCIGRGVAAVRHKSGATSFTYHSMANLYPDFARFEAEGTVFGSINKDSFEKLRFVIPPTEIIAAYERQAGPLDEQIRTLESQSRTLATLRDTLLPKLLSGELRATDAKVIAAETA